MDDSDLKRNISQNVDLNKVKDNRKGNLLLLCGYIISSILLTGGFYMAFGIFILFASIFGNARGLYVITFVAPQVILLPVFYYFYQRDNGRLVWLEKTVMYLIFVFIIYLILFVFPK